MKAVFPAGSGRVELREIPVPKLGKGEVLVEMHACGICGTDIEKTRGETQTPEVLGHEVSGVVNRVGEKVREVSEGDRVVVHHHVSCGKCYYCRAGNQTLCELYPKTNLDPCGFAEYFRVPRENTSRGAILKIPSDLSFEEASFLEPLGCCIRSLSKIGEVAGKSVAILGVGSTGVLMVQLLKSSGAGVIIASDLSASRLNFCKSIGANIAVDPFREDLASAVRSATDGRGVDLAIVATGSLKALDQAFSIVRRGGVVNLFGMPTKDAKLEVDPSRLFIREVRIEPSYSTTEEEMQKAMQLVASQRVRVAELISHKFKLPEAVEAFRLAADAEKSVKVMIVH